MLSTISWPQYLAAVAVTSTCYYSYLLLRYYQREISGLFTPKEARSKINENTSTAPKPIMGGIVETELINFLDDTEVLFAEEDQPERTDLKQENQEAANTGTEPLQQQLIKEADELIEVFAGVDDKSEFISLLTILANTYRQYATAIDFPGLVAHILQAAPTRLHFELAAGDLSAINN